MAAKLDIFVILEYLDQGHLGLYDELRAEPEMLAELDRNIGWMIPQWFTGLVSDAEHRDRVVLFDEFCVQCWDSIGKHPELQTKLLACLGTGSGLRHRFFKPGKRGTVGELIKVVREVYPDLHDDQIALWCRHHDESEFVQFMERLGKLPKEIDELRPEYERLRG